MVPSEARSRLIDMFLFLILSVLCALVAYQYQRDPKWFSKLATSAQRLISTGFNALQRQIEVWLR